MWFLGENGEPLDPKKPFTLRAAKMGAPGDVHATALKLCLERRYIAYVSVGKNKATFKFLRRGRKLHRLVSVANKSENPPNYLQQSCQVAIWEGFEG